MKTAEERRGRNRALINDLFNGVPPYSTEEEEENQIQVNVNWKEGTNVLHTARSQYENAFQKPGNLFKVSLPDAPADKALKWGRTITREINKPIKESRAYFQTLRNVFAGIVLHGVGARIWEDDNDWEPSYAAIEDMLIPTDTDLTMANLPYIAIRRKMRPGQLFKKTILKGKNIDPGWDLAKVKKILAEFKDENSQPQQYNWSENPEKMAELWKQNLSYYDSDAAPTIWFWDFYYREDEKEKRGWYRGMMLDKDCVKTSSGPDPIEFVYKSKRPFAQTLDHIIHFQFGDGNNVPPFKYHSIRSLGWLLFDVVSLLNRLRCQFTQHVFEQMMMLFRVQDPADRDRLMKILLFKNGIIPEGASVVTAAERYGVDPNLVQNLLSNFRQTIGESSSAYTQAVDSGTQKERTKFEVEAMLSQMSALMSSMLTLAYRQEFFAVKEIARRFCNKRSDAFAVKKFRQRCISAGVPEKWLDAEHWDIEVEQVLGGGNKMLELAQASRLREMRPTLAPDSQLEVDRIFIGALTDNDKLAERLVPVDKGRVTDAMHDAELAFGTLMQGVPMRVRGGLNHIEQVETLLNLMAITITHIQQTGGVGTPRDVIGLQNVAEYIGQHIQLIAQDENEKQRVAAYGKILSKLMNEVRAFMQRQMQAAEEQNQEIDPVAEAKIRSQQMADAQKLQSKEQAHQQKMEQKRQSFEFDIQASVLETMTELKNATMLAMAKAEAALQSAQNGKGEKKEKS